MTQRTLNVDLLKDVVKYIEEHPHEWNQDYFAEWFPACGTTFCVAGTVARLDPEVEILWLGEEDRYMNYGVDVKRGNEIVPIEVHAKQKLGLTNKEADYLFYDVDTDIVELRNAVDSIINGDYR